MNIYFFPPQRKANRKNVVNPYVRNFIKQLAKFSEVNEKPTNIPPLLDLALNIYKKDAVVLNWIENTPLKRFGTIQYYFLLIILNFLYFKRVKTIWVMHNMHPHSGKNIKSQNIIKWLYDHATLILTHSSEAREYAKSNGCQNIIFLHHPVSTFDTNSSVSYTNNQSDSDILIWGTIEPYKGIYEFIKYCNDNKSLMENKKITIIGKCNNDDYFKLLNKIKPKYINLINQKIEFNELSYLIKNTKIVLFPYLKGSISSSGALIDTIALGGKAVGPNSGAFVDLEREGVCLTYESFNDIDRIINNVDSISESNVDKFIKENSWERFCMRIQKEITSSSKRNK